MDYSKITSLLSAAPIVPVLTIPDDADCTALAQCFQRAGLTAIEVTLRTPGALKAIEVMKAAAPDLAVGAGTIINRTTLEAALAAGSDFLVSPGITSDIHQAAQSNDALLIPGVATPSEAMQRYDDGYQMLKLFPANIAGGPAMLKALSSPLPYLSFMPTGGVNEKNLMDYLSLPNVIAVGGTWLAPAKDIQKEKWLDIGARTRQALKTATG